ncbi:NAD-dependent epimerase/dehydratase family protein [Haloarchaeobius sp. TZWWS8]|uniref:NAD-dependent epimerase/dehydratase family protein n=1 Tax=Haloarchaeobius sp. TZWWS8 TaxID=3446121 RepID=UPI003EC10A3D
MDVVIGNGPLGGAVVRELRAQGRLVRVVEDEERRERNEERTTYPPEVPVVDADLTDPAVTTRVLADASAVFVCPRTTPPVKPTDHVALLESIVEGAAANGVPVVLADTLAAYGPSATPFREDMQPLAVGRWGTAQADAAEGLLAAHAAGRVSAVVVRTSDLFGPSVRDSPFGDHVFGRLLAGKSALVLGDPDVTHAVTYAEDAARALVTVADIPAAHGQVWHAPTAPAVTPREFVELAAAAADTEPKIRQLSRWRALLLAPFSRRYRRLRECWYAYDQPYLVDDRKYATTFGVVATPLEDGIERTVDWYRDGGETTTVATPPPAE